MRTSIIRLFLLFLFIGLGLLAGFYSGRLRVNYPSYVQYPVQGIDVSHHQQHIQWQKLDKKQVRFAFIKATEGGDFKDKHFVENREGAKKAGIAWGAYHFFTFCKSGREQAANFMALVPKEEKMLPPVIDLEYSGNCKLQRTKEAVIADLDTMVTLFTEYYQRKPMFYTTHSFYQDFHLERYDCPIWIRSVYGRPDLENKQEWLFWQFADKGILKGIETFVDLNVFAGTEKDFEALLENQ